MAKFITCLGGSSKLKTKILVAAGVCAVGFVLALGLHYGIRHYHEPSKSNSINLRTLMLVNLQ